MTSQMVYTGIRVRNLDRSIRFYTRGLGMRLRGRGRNPAIHGAWAQLESPKTGQLLELNWYSSRSPFYAPWRRGVELDHLCFRVGDLERALQAASAAGGRRRGPTFSTPGWKMVDVEDPNGICIELSAALGKPRPGSAIRRDRTRRRGPRSRPTETGRSASERRGAPRRGGKSK